MNNKNKKNLPTKALNLFDALINQLIDGTEEQSRQFSAQQCVGRETAMTTSCSGIRRGYAAGRDSSMASESSMRSNQRQGAGREASMTSESGTSAFAGKTSQPYRQGAGRESSMPTFCSDTLTPSSGFSENDSSITSDSLLSSRRMNVRQQHEKIPCAGIIAPYPIGSLGSESSMTTHQRQGAGRESSMLTSCSDTLTPSREYGRRVASVPSESNILQSYRQGAGRESSMTSSSQRVKLTTKRLAGGIDGCEVTVATTNEDGNPLVIRAVCPNFDPRRIWVNGKPFDYIDGESDNPIIDSSASSDYGNYHQKQMEDIVEEEEEQTSADYEDDESTLNFSNY